MGFDSKKPGGLNSVTILHAADTPAKVIRKNNPNFK